MITHNNLQNFDEEFFKNQIEVLANQAFPEFNSNTHTTFNDGIK